MKTFIENNFFVIEDYNNFKPFASFLPAIAGLFGKPLWVFYVNRGQCISCFGTKDKNGAILEFVAANKAWRLTPLEGFRTFLKINEHFYEPFQNIPICRSVQRMYISSDMLKITETNPELKLEFTVEYFTIPNENFPALARIVKIRNVSEEKRKIFLWDGLPVVVPYGTTDFLLKNMSRLADGWFNGVIFVTEKKIPVYKLLVEPEDRPEVVYIDKANFYYGFVVKNTQVKDVEYIVDSDLIFGQVKDFSFPQKIIKNEFKNDKTKTAGSKTPCAFGYFVDEDFGSGEEIVYCCLIGNVSKLSLIEEIQKEVSTLEYFEKKKQENKQIIDELTQNMYTKSASREFDNYCKQTFLDNLLRGGYPIVIGKGENKRIYYIYSRIHGDMEREYNNFVITPTYFSQGNGNYRDVLQNRRNDVFFNPEIKDELVIYFMNLIQLDGYNPLSLNVSKFRVKNKKKLLEIFNTKDKKAVLNFIKNEFTLGEFFDFIEINNIETKKKKQEIVDLIVETSEMLNEVYPVTGFWSDHWHYNIDLIESYLSIYPEKLQEILLEKKVFTFYDNPMVVAAREEKYVLFHNKPRQLKSVYFHPEKEKIINSRKDKKYVVRTKYGKGEIYKTTLITKLLCLIANKFALLDPFGLGIEMEAERPNWCDALNGLPGLFGSSTAESLELKRLIRFLLDSIEKLNLLDNKKISLPEEIYDFIKGLIDITKMYNKNNFKFWDERHNLLEKYRKRTLFGISGKEKSISVKEIKDGLKVFLSKLDEGIKKVVDKNTNMVYTYFENKILKYKVLTNKKNICKNIKPFKFTNKVLPYFLEGPMHYLRCAENKQQAKKIHLAVLNSDLYDKKLKMFKINAPLKNVEGDIGRIKSFTSGWLENESIWLHMEYKYLLELIKSGLVEEFWQIAKDTLVPFMNPEIYGRNIFENVSFITSSAHPDETLHGQGFVARLSGSTAEFISIWRAITSGLNPFFVNDKGEICLKFTPQLPYWMFDDKGEFRFKFLGRIDVIYYNKTKKNTYGENCAKIKLIKLENQQGDILEIRSNVISPQETLKIKQGDIKRIYVYME